MGLTKGAEKGESTDPEVDPVAAAEDSRATIDFNATRDTTSQYFEAEISLKSI